MNPFSATDSLVARSWLIFLIFAGIAGLLLLFRVIIRGRPVKLDIFGTTMDIKDGSEVNQAGKQAVMDVFTMAITTASTVSFLKTKQILSDQMYYLEDKLILVQEALTTCYRSLMSDKLKQAEDHSVTVTSNKEYQFFTSLVTLMAEDQKRTCRQIFIKNNFSHFSDREFDEYVEEKLTLLRTKALLFIRDLYPSDKMLVTFEEVEMGVFAKVAPALDTHYEQAFRRAVQIYKARHEEADKLDKDLHDYILNTYGVDIAAPSRAAKERENVSDR